MAQGAPVRRDLGVLYASVLASRVGFGVIIIVFPAYISSSSDIAVAVALALYPLAEALAALPIGQFCDTRGRKVTFVASLGYIAVLMASIGATRNIYAIAAIHALMGVGAAGVTVSTLTMVTDLTGESNRGKGMGAFDFSNVGGYAVGLVAGYYLRAYFASDLGLAFAATAAVLAAAFGIGLAVLKEPAHLVRSADRSLNPLRALDARAKSVLPVWLGVTVLLGMVFFLPRAFSGVGIGSGQTAGLLLLGLAVLGFGAVGWGALSDRIGRGKVLVVGAVGMVGLLASLALSVDGGIDSLARSLPLLGVFGIMTAALVPTVLATAGDRATADRRGSAMGLYSVMLSGGTAVGTLVAGFVHRASGLSGMLEAATVLFLAACAMSLVLWSRAKAKES
ncbi:MAG: MFS transporter [Thaumarchaeota archaeon]|nr:MFS transporter [Nitrososphaerota archaeon]